MFKSLRAAVRRPVSWMVFACLVVLLVALAACGGDSGSTTTTTTASSANPAAPATSVMIKESKDSAGKDVYACDPTTITIKKGDTVSFTNQSDEKQDFDQGDAQKAGVDFVMDLNQSTTATFKTAGTFTIKSEKGATITVTVQ